MQKLELMGAFSQEVINRKIGDRFMVNYPSTEELLVAEHLHIYYNGLTDKELAKRLKKISKELLNGTE